MSILEGLIKHNCNIAIDMSTDKNETHNTYRGYNVQINIPLWLVLCFVGFWLVTNIPSCFYSPTATRSSSFELQVDQWASDYPTDLRDRWAWCYLDSSQNWSTDQKLREDVRLKSVQVLSDSERAMLIPLDRQIAEAIPMQKTSLKETYEAVGLGLRVNEWSPASRIARSAEDVPKPEPQPPNRRRIFRR